MKVVNIPSTKMMKKFFASARDATSLASSNSRYCAELQSSLRANGSRECAPEDERNCARAVMTGSAKQSIARHNGWMDCFAALAMTLIRLRQNVNARHKAGHNVISVDNERFDYAWLATVLPSAAWAAARRAIGT